MPEFSQHAERSVQLLRQTTKGWCEVKYEPKTTAEQRRELVQYLCNVNHRGAKVQRICDDLAACEAALAEEQARIAELEAIVREFTEACGENFTFPSLRKRALALLQLSEKPAADVCGRCGEKLKQTNKGVQYCECWMPMLGKDGAR